MLRRQGNKTLEQMWSERIIFLDILYFDILMHISWVSASTPSTISFLFLFNYYDVAELLRHWVDFFWRRV